MDERKCVEAATQIVHWTDKLIKSCGESEIDPRVTALYYIVRADPDRDVMSLLGLMFAPSKIESGHN